MSTPAGDSKPFGFVSSCYDDACDECGPAHAANVNESMATPIPELGTEIADEEISSALPGDTPRGHMNKPGFFGTSGAPPQTRLNPGRSLPGTLKYAGDINDFEFPTPDLTLSVIARLFVFTVLRRIGSGSDKVPHLLVKKNF